MPRSHSELLLLLLLVLLLLLLVELVLLMLMLVRMLVLNLHGRLQQLRIVRRHRVMHRGVRRRWPVCGHDLVRCRVGRRHRMVWRGFDDLRRRRHALHRLRDASDDLLGRGHRVDHLDAWWWLHLRVKWPTSRDDVLLLLLLGSVLGRADDRRR